MRICKKCEIKKDITEYYLKKNGKVRISYYKVCYNIVYKTEYDKEYYENNKEKFKQNYKSCCLNNYISNYMKSYRENNKDELSRKKINYFNKKFNNDSLFKLTCNIRCLIKND